MLIRYKDLVTLNLVATDGSKHPVRDVFIDENAFALTHVVADLGGWFEDRKGVIGIGRFGQPDIASTTWPCKLDEDALQERAGRDPAAAPEGRDPAASPEVGDALLAPAGAEAAPHLIQAPGGGAPSGAAKLRSMRDCVSGTSVNASDGHLGTLMGMIFDSQTWQARYLVVETGDGGLPEHQRVFETNALASKDFDTRTVTLNLTLAKAEHALDLHEVDDIESKWYNKVMAYYGLQS